MNPNRYVNAIFAGDSKAKAESAWQYDYGLYLRIQGLSLPAAVEVHFALQQTGGEAEPRIGLTQDGVTDVLIPESMLKNSDVTKDYNPGEQNTRSRFRLKADLHRQYQIRRRIRNYSGKQLQP